MRTLSIQDKLQEYVAVAYLTLERDRNADYNKEVVSYALKRAEAKRPWDDGSMDLRWDYQADRFRFHLYPFGYNMPFGSVGPRLRSSQLRAFEKHIDSLAKQIAEAQINGLRSVRGSVQFERVLQKHFTP